MHFTSETSSNGVVERNFTLGEVTGLLWSPASGSDHAPVVLMAHSGGQHKRVPGILGRAHRFVTGCGFHAAAIDAPGHGDRPERRRTSSTSLSYDRLRRRASRSARSSWDSHPSGGACRAGWQATLDALQELPEIGAKGAISCWGIMQGTAMGCRLRRSNPGSPRRFSVVSGMNP
jgi:hypothetical protein